jgi:hypothetical protein
VSTGGTAARPRRAPGAPAASAAGGVAEAAVAAAGGALLVGLPVLLPGSAGDAGRAVAVVVVQAAVAAAWVALAGLRPAGGVFVLGLAAAGAADLAALLTARPEAGSVLPVLGVGFVLAVLVQMLRRAPRTALVSSLAGSAVLVCAAAAPALWVVAGRADGGDPLVRVVVLAAAAGLVVAALVDVVAVRPRLAAGAPAGVPGLVLGTLAGAATAYLSPRSGALEGDAAVLLTGAGTALVAVLVRAAGRFAAADRAGSADGPDDGPADGPADVPGWSAPLLAALLPLAVLAPAAEVLVGALLARSAG